MDEELVDDEGPSQGEQLDPNSPIDHGKESSMVVRNMSKTGLVLNVAEGNGANEGGVIISRELGKSNSRLANTLEKKLSIATESKAQKGGQDAHQDGDYISQEILEKSKENSETTGNPSHLGNFFNIRDPRYSQEQKNANMVGKSGEGSKTRKL